MSEKIIVPALGESVTEATVSKWLKAVGDEVSSDEPLVELETDKVNVEVPSPSDGVLEKISVKEGTTVEVGAFLGSVGAASTKLSIDKKEKKYTPPPKQEETIPVYEKETKKNEEVSALEIPSSNGSETFVLNNEEKEEAPLILDQEHEDEKIVKPSIKIASPSARKIAQDKNINLEQIKGSGRRGMVLKEDLISLMGTKPAPNLKKTKNGPEERIKMTRLRLTIAKRLKEAQNNAAMLTTFNEVDMHNIMEIRKNYQEEFKKKYSVKLGFMSFFVKASIAALKNYPAINAEIQDEEIVYKNYYNISFAVGTDKGLVVPVLRNPDEMSFADIEKNIVGIGEKARNGKLTISDLQGGTFTITNGGIYGSMLSTPILNPPQSGVLGMHNIIDRTVVVNGEIKIRPMMYLALSYDHRIVDGKEAVSFLKNIKDFLEEPKRLFLNV
tara:strand:+ start:56 stop:1381 length:1326 start_codon:yes stop_codon:yes gene_type:complete